MRQARPFTGKPAGRAPRLSGGPRNSRSLGQEAARPAGNRREPKSLSHDRRRPGQARRKAGTKPPITAWKAAAVSVDMAGNVCMELTAPAKNAVI